MVVTSGWKKAVGKTKIGLVRLGNNVFVGAKTVVLPNVDIGYNCIIGANSCVTKDIPAGMPAKIIMTTEQFKEKYKAQFSKYTYYGNVSSVSNEEIVTKLKEEKIGFVD